MVQLFACDQKRLCNHSSVTHRCQLYGGFMVSVAGFTSHCGEVTAHSWLLQLSSKSLTSVCTLCPRIAIGKQKTTVWGSPYACVPLKH